MEDNDMLQYRQCSYPNGVVSNVFSVAWSKSKMCHLLFVRHWTYYKISLSALSHTVGLLLCCWMMQSAVCSLGRDHLYKCNCTKKCFFIV